MALPLSSLDLSRLDAAQRDLLALTHEADGSEWPTRACAALRDLLEAAHATFFYVAPDRMLTQTTLPLELQEIYVREYAPLDQATTRALERGYSVAHLHDVVTLAEFSGSALYQEFALPNGLHDAMMVRDRVGPGADVWIATQFPRRMEEVEIARARILLSLALPAFRAGARGFLSLQRQQATLGRMVDALAVPLLVCDESGGAVHENAALQSVLRVEPGAETVREAMRNLAATLGRHAADRDQPAVPSVEVGGAIGTYQLNATFALESAPGGRRLLLVQLRPRKVASHDRLRHELGLTRREAEVATLLARRMSNREIADALSISVHTAERHVEKVLQKLGIRSRYEVRDRVGVLGHVDFDSSLNSV